MRLLIASVAFAALSGCAAVPKVNDTPAPDRSVQIVGARGALTAEQSKALLARIAPEPGEAGVLKRHLAIEQAVAETPLIAGNRTRLLIDGDRTFAAMFAAIEQAKSTLDLEYYIFEDVEYDGKRLSDLLIAKQQQGVEINIIYDGFGSASTPAAFFTRLKDAGIRVAVFHPINLLDPVSLNDRDHRKILVADGSRAIVGGINLSTTYQSSGVGKSASPADKPEQHWRDTDMEVEGPAVAQLQNLFFEHWAQVKGASLDREKYFPSIPRAGTEVMRIVGSAPAKDMPRFYVTLLSAIRNAEKNVWLTTAYFVPTDQEEDDLKDAARRGVDVRLLLPSDSDSKMALAIGRSHYGYLLEAGVRIYEVQNEVLHSKTASIDGVWTAIGSSNFDPRSVVFNDEVDAIVLGSATAQDFGHMFESDLSKAKQIDRAAWRRRPIGERFLELFELTSFLWQNWF